MQCKTKELIEKFQKNKKDYKFYLSGNINFISLF